MIIKDDSYDKERYVFELLMTDREYNDIKTYLPLAKWHTSYNAWNMTISYFMTKKEVELFPSFYERMRDAFGMNDSENKQRKTMNHFRNGRAEWTLGSCYADFVLLDYKVYDDIFGELAQKCKEYIHHKKEVK